MTIRSKNRWSVHFGSLGIVILVGVAVAAGRLGAQERGRGAAPAPRAPENVLAGVIDMHAHHDPDERARNIDAIDLALYARLRGMRGIVLKSHGQETSGVAWLTAKMVPGL